MIFQYSKKYIIKCFIFYVCLPKGNNFLKTEPNSSGVPRVIAPTSSKTEAIDHDYIRRCISSTGLPEETKNILLASWRDNTRSRYSTVIKQWQIHCSKRGEDVIAASVASVLTFLTQMFLKGNKYSSICIARSALASIVCIKGFGNTSDRPLSKRFVEWSPILYVSVYKAI